MGYKVLERMEFESIRAMAAYLDSTPRAEGAGNWSTRDQGEQTSLHTWEESMDIARDGGWWAEGAEKMVQGVADASALRENMPDPMISNDVAGFMPDVPAYLAGVPDSMYAYQSGDMVTAQTPTISIAVGSVSHTVTSESVFNRGVAILSLIDAVEAIGYRVQLDYVGDNRYGATMKPIRVCLKRPQDQWSAGVVAFATASASMLRRLVVGVMERDAECNEATTSTYGKGDDGYMEEYSLAFPYLTTNKGYSTLESALRTVERMAKDFGMEVNLGSGA